MSVTVIPDMVQGARSVDAARGREIVRRFGIYGLPTSGGPSTILELALTQPGVPALYSVHPVVTYATCQERRLASTDTSNGCLLDIVYRSAVNNSAGLGGIVWGVTDTIQGNFIQTATAANQTDALFTWYSPHATAATSEPGGLDGSPQGSFTAPKFYPTRVLRAGGAILGGDWNFYAPSVYSLVGKLNNAPWRGNATATALFIGPNTTTTDFGQSYVIELNYLIDPLGHSAIGLYYTPDTNEHPSDCATEAAIRAVGDPGTGIIQRNGITLAGIYQRGDFSIFTF